MNSDSNIFDQKKAIEASLEYFLLYLQSASDIHRGTPLIAGKVFKEMMQVYELHYHEIPKFIYPYLKSDNHERF